MQRFFAEDGPGWRWMTVVPFAGPIVVAWHIGPLPLLQGTGEDLAWFVWALLLAWGLGRWSALVLGYPLLGAAYFARGVANGAPYEKADLVQILAGPHEGRVASIYDIWPSRSEVRVGLGDWERDQFEDVFGYCQVCRPDRFEAC
jgi:hypothetical protein